MKIVCYYCKKIIWLHHQLKKYGEPARCETTKCHKPASHLIEQDRQGTTITNLFCAQHTGHIKQNGGAAILKLQYPQQWHNQKYLDHDIHQKCSNEYFTKHPDILLNLADELKV